MKLVDILARELKFWPEGWRTCAQDRDCRVAGFFCSDLIFDSGVGRGWDSSEEISSYIAASRDVLGVIEQAEDWSENFVTRAEWQAAVDALNAPKVVEWAIGSLPPIGSVVEWDGCTFSPEEPQEKDLRVGDQVTIIAHLKDGDFEMAAFTFNPKIHNSARGSIWVNQGSYGCFRPIRTAEQVAAEEREKAVDELVELFVNHYEYPKGAEQYLPICRAIHDAGYRKEPKPCGS